MFFHLGQGLFAVLTLIPFCAGLLNLPNTWCRATYDHYARYKMRCIFRSGTPQRPQECIETTSCCKIWAQRARNTVLLKSRLIPGSIEESVVRRAFDPTMIVSTNVVCKEKFGRNIAGPAAGCVFTCQSLQPREYIEENHTEYLVGVISNEGSVRVRMVRNLDRFYLQCPEGWSVRYGEGQSLKALEDGTLVLVPTQTGECYDAKRQAQPTGERFIEHISEGPIGESLSMRQEEPPALCLDLLAAFDRLDAVGETRNVRPRLAVAQEGATEDEEYVSLELRLRSWAHFEPEVGASGSTSDQPL